jgi:hypothetical protein
MAFIRYVRYASARVDLFLRERSGQALLAQRNSMRPPKPVRHQRQVHARHINKQRHSDEEDSNPESPITMGSFPIWHAVMVNVISARSLLMVRVRTLSHSFPAFSIQFPGFEPVGT